MFCYKYRTSHIFILECVYLLLAHGAPVKLKNNFGWSPLAEAISYGDRQISKFLQLITLTHCPTVYRHVKKRISLDLDMPTRHTVVQTMFFFHNLTSVSCLMM